MASRLSVLLVALALALAGCTGTTNGAEVGGASPAVDGPTSDPTLQPDDRVNLTIYLRTGEGAGASLEAVTREVEVSDDLPRRALELLLAGPTADEGRLKAPLPTATVLRDLDVEGGTAHVTLSPEVIREAGMVGDSSAHEALALGAIVNTLTEFPSIDRVQVTVAGQGIRPGEFWGAWGLPAVLVRDESLIGSGSESGESVVDAGRFVDESQTVGSADATGLEVASVRTRDRLTYVRVIVEVVAANDPETTASVPRARARRSGDEVVLDVAGIASYSGDLDGVSQLELSDPAFRSLGVTKGEGTVELRLDVAEAADRGFWLHTLSSPTRIVLDVRKTAQAPQAAQR